MDFDLGEVIVSWRGKKREEDVKISRRWFVSLLGAPLVSTVSVWPAEGARIQTVRGPVGPAALGVTLMHEHVLVDFIGADKISPARYDREEVFGVALPKLKEVARRGCKTLVECTPAYLARDAALLERLSKASGVRLLTNTGYYGAARDKYVPAHAYAESAEQLADRWVEEFRVGIEGTGVRPGFVKIGVDAGPLSEIDRKLVTAAALCHLETGLAIHVHTGNGAAAHHIIKTIKTLGVSPEAYVWVHAQNEKDRTLHLAAAREGAWVEFDGVAEKSLDEHAAAVVDMIRHGLLGRTLISQDAGWYHVGEQGGGTFRAYTFLFDHFLPELRKRGVSKSQIRRLLVENPARVLAIEVRKLSK